MRFFPLPKKVMENKEFCSLTPATKVVYWFLAAEYNIRGGSFFLSDLEVAVRVGVSEKTVSRARLSLEESGLLHALRGFRTPEGRRRATEYREVKYARVHGGKLSPFAQMRYHTFQSLLHGVRHSELHPQDVVVYMYLAYWRHMLQLVRGEDQFYFPTAKLRLLTGLESASQIVRKLADWPVCRRYFFSFFNNYQVLYIEGWWEPGDPDEDPQSRRESKIWEDEILGEIWEIREERGWVSPSRSEEE